MSNEVRCYMLILGEALESWTTFYILTPFAFPICHIIQFPVQTMQNFIFLTLFYFLLYYVA